MASINDPECGEKPSALEKTSKWIEFQESLIPWLLGFCITGMVIIGLIGAYPNVLHGWKKMQRALDSATCKLLSPQEALSIKTDGIDCSIIGNN